MNKPEYDALSELLAHELHCSHTQYSTCDRLQAKLNQLRRPNAGNQSK